MSTFVHLHLHTEYSISDGLVRIDRLLQRCVTMGVSAIAITDQNNFFGLVKFYKAALKLGIKPILGADVFIHNEKEPEKPFCLTLLAQSNTGYKNLMLLLTKTYLSGQKHGKPNLEKNWLTTETVHGLIALSGGRSGDIGHALLNAQSNSAEKLLSFWLDLFPERFYLEIQRTGRPNEENYLQAALELAEKTNTPVVATNDVRFIDRDDFEAHEARVCVHDGYVVDDANRPRLYSEEQYLRSSQEMQELFQDIPEAILNSIEISKRCNATIALGESFLPIFPVPDQSLTVEDYFEQQSKIGLTKRLAVIFAPENLNKPRQTEDIYQARLQHEIKTIKQMGFASYFLIVADFINWAQNNDVPVGPGRGSGAGSLVAYSLNITNVDPLQHELLFERFLNPERVSLPDFDIDFCMDGRDRVIDYVMQRYGHDRVAQIATHGTMAAKAVVRDVGRVLGYPYGFVDKIAKLIPFTLGITLSDALQQEELLKKRYQEEDEVTTLIDLALKMEGLVRNVGKHAGGIVIAPTFLTDFTPLYCEPETPDHTITQYDKDDVEAIGLVKFDFLGLRTLTIIAHAVKTINQNRQKNGEQPLNIDLLPLDDKPTYDLLQTGKTTAVFQIESRGMQELTKRTKPDCFEDIVALIALYRPGPLQSGMVDDYVERKHGRAAIIYPHPSLEKILRPTYGVILYQEQVMQIAQILSGYSLGSADILRKAMGKKKPEEMAKQRAIFLDGAAKNHVDKHVANTIFDLMEKFAGYGFNKSHSVAYALIAYQTAWLKAHYPAEFMAAVLSADMDNTDKVVKLILECKAMGLGILPPDVNYSYYQFTVNDKSEIVYGLGAIKGAGEAAIENIVTNRQKGTYQNLFDLCKRNDKQKLNRKLLEAFTKGGALDSIGPNRAQIFASINKGLQISEQNAKNERQKQLSIFFNDDDSDEKENCQNSSLYLAAEAWNDKQYLDGEKETLGFYLSGHPIERYLLELNQFTKPLSELADNITTTTPVATGFNHNQRSPGKTIVTAGIINKVRPIITKTGKQMAVIALEDALTNSEVVVFSDLYNEKRELLLTDQLIIIEGEVDIDNFSGNPRLRARDLMTLENARTKLAKFLLLKIDKDNLPENITNEICKQNHHINQQPTPESSENSKKNFETTLKELTNLLETYTNGNCPICIEYKNEQARTRVILGDNWRVQPKDQLLEELRKMLGEMSVEVKYT